MGIVTTDINLAADTLAAGRLCAIPTETVYGLAADASNRNAVQSVFAAKGRPADHPLIVHVADAADIADWITHLPDWAHALIDHCVPGPLTIVGPRGPRVLGEVTGGQDTVAVRVPSHRTAHALLTACRLRGVTGLVAPSANLYGHVSPTTAEHVVADLGPWLDSHQGLVLDGGACTVGVESTIVLATGDNPVVLRPGGVTRKVISEATGLEVVERETSAPRVSGSHSSHYAPTAAVEIVEAMPADAVGCGVIAFHEITTPVGAIRLAAPTTVEDFARDLYSALRAADDHALSRVLIVTPTDEGLAEAVRDRVRRAAYPQRSTKA